MRVRREMVLGMVLRMASGLVDISIIRMLVPVVVEAMLSRRKDRVILR